MLTQIVANKKGKFSTWSKNDISKIHFLVLLPTFFDFLEHKNNCYSLPISSSLSSRNRTRIVANVADVFGFARNELGIICKEIKFQLQFIIIIILLILGFT